MSRKTDLILLQSNIARADASALMALFDPSKVAKKISVTYSAWAPNETDPSALGVLHVYLKLDKPRRLTKKDIRKSEERWAKLCNSADAFASRLSKAFETSGASTGETPVCHYVVQTTPEKGWLKEISQWYDQEHMPGLAAVPGCIHAVRMINLDHGPRSFACYDLVSSKVMGSSAWLNVRATPWSSKCRPHFTKTKRNMFEVM